MERLDAVLVEHVLRLLPPYALAAAEGTCTQWAELITQRQLWRAHAAAGVHLATGDGSAAAAGSTRAQAATVDWRQACLQQAAAAKWRAGKLLLSATLPGHTAAVSCMATLQHIIATGSRDCSARVWDLQQGSQLHLLRHAEPLVAVALPSVALCVTATATSAHLWRQGKAIRRFDVTPGGSITCLALTDMQLLLGSTAAAVQHFDLFSGSQQLITRHGSSVTCMLAHQQQQQQQQQQQGVAAAEDDWHVIVGTADGQVSCMAASTGRALWQLPTMYPSRVVAFRVQLYQHQQQFVRHHLNQLQHQVQLLYVLNARSQLICWALPGSSSSASHDAPQLQLPTCKQCIGRLLRTTNIGCKARKVKQVGKASAGLTKQAGAGSTTAALTRAAASPGAVVLTGAAGTPAVMCTDYTAKGSSNVKPVAVCELPVQPATGLLASLTTHAATGCSSLACSEFGSTCLFVGSSDGYLSMAELVHAGSSSEISSSSAGQGGSSNSGGPGSSSSSQEAEDGGVLLPQQQQGGAAVSAVAGDAVPTHVAAGPLGLQHTTGSCAAGSCSCSASGSSSCVLQLQLARRCPLVKLAKLVRQRAGRGAVLAHTLHLTPAAAAAVDVAGSWMGSDGAGSSGGTAEAFGSKPAAASASARNEISHDALHDAVGVRSAVFTSCGRLAVGVACGHVCLLRFRVKL